MAVGTGSDGSQHLISLWNLPFRFVDLGLVEARRRCHDRRWVHQKFRSVLDWSVLNKVHARYTRLFQMGFRLYTNIQIKISNLVPRLLNRTAKFTREDEWETGEDFNRTGEWGSGRIVNKWTRRRVGVGVRVRVSKSKIKKFVEYTKRR